MDDQEAAPSLCSVDETNMEIQATESKSNKSRTSKPGIVYLSSIPYFMTVKSIRKYFAKYGAIDRVFLQVETRIGASGKKERHYTEGWVEFKDKRLVLLKLS
uniref:RRM domain-containing protein n=1 Tax=Romanomermis culicivorax TaxID=13658 RepID=A0A915J4S7_ROMCU